MAYLIDVFVVFLELLLASFFLSCLVAFIKWLFKD